MAVLTIVSILLYLFEPQWDVPEWSVCTALALSVCGHANCPLGLWIRGCVTRLCHLVTEKGGFCGRELVPLALGFITLQIVYMGKNTIK